MKKIIAYKGYYQEFKSGLIIDAIGIFCITVPIVLILVKVVIGI